MLCFPTRTSVVLAALVALASVSVSSVSVRALRAQRKDDKDKKPAEGLTAAQRQEAAPLARLVDEVMKGAAPGTFSSRRPRKPLPRTARTRRRRRRPRSPLTWRQDFLKAQHGLIFVPFTVTVEPGKMGSSVAGYLRVAPKGATGLPAPRSGREGADSYPFEDVYFTELRGGAAGQPAEADARVRGARRAPTTSISRCASVRRAAPRRTRR